MTKTVNVWVDPDGSVRFVHDDDVADALSELGPMKTVRAGHVEPCPGGWTVELTAALGGGVTGPFGRRDAALAAERAMVDTAMEEGRRP